MKRTDNCEVAFCKLKGLLVTPPVLKVVEPDKLYILQTDASDLGLGAVLSRMKDGENIQWPLQVESFCPERRITQSLRRNV